MGWGLLTLKNDPTRSLAPRIVLKYITPSGWCGIQILSLKKPGPFVSMTRLPYFSRELVAWLHEPQPKL